MNQQFRSSTQPSSVYVAATWASLGIGVAGYLLGLWNAMMMLNEKGYYFAVFLLGMFSAVTLQKIVRDRAEGLAVTNIFLGMSWAMFLTAIALLCVGLFNADLALSEKGFYGMAFVLSLFSIITVQKNVRDLSNAEGDTDAAAYPSAITAIDAAMEVSEYVS